MKEHFIRLLTDTELNVKQKQVWYKAVERFLDAAEYAPNEVNYIDGLTTTRDELKGDDDFPYVYIVYLNDKLPIDIAEQIVMPWDRVYPRDFEIETSAIYNPHCDCGDCDCSDCDCSDCDCDVEIDEAMHEEIQRRASKFLHNRWVEHQVQEGWRYGAKIHNEHKTDPRLRDWDSLNENYRREIEMTQEDAVKFFKQYPHIFV
jgi:hypothetical protein